MWINALPEMIILVTLCLALLGDLFFKQRIKFIALFIASIGIIIAATVTGLSIGQYSQILFHGLFISDDLGRMMKLVILIVVFLSFVYANRYLTEREMPAGDYYVLGLFSLLGMMILVSAHSMLTLYLGLELLSLPLYAMTAIRRNHGLATEAAVKYFMMGSVVSAVMLYGLSLLYGATGNLDLHVISQVISTHKESHYGILSFALVFILAGVGFKLALVPFHMWVPDVYDGAPTSVSLFLSAGPKIAGMGMAFRLLDTAFTDLVPQWQQIIVVMAILSIVVGNTAAIAQTNIKRMLGYSTISHMGYALLGLLAATPAGYSASLFYILVYAIMSVAAFGLLVLLSHSGVEIENIKDLNGLNKRNPWLALMMMITLLSMAGIPPTVGFFAKLMVLKALVDVQMTWVAVLALVFAVIGSFYYLRVIKVMYFDEAENTTPIRLPSLTTKWLFSINSLSLLYLGIFPSTFIAACVGAFIN